MLRFCRSAVCQSLQRKVDKFGLWFEVPGIMHDLASGLVVRVARTASFRTEQAHRVKGHGRDSLGLSLGWLGASCSSADPNPRALHSP